MKEFIPIKFVGETVDILYQANPAYDNFLIIENGRRVLYLRMNKALYGCVVSSLLWYELFTSKLVNMGFKISAYDLCVANKFIDGKQCTI